MARDANLTVPIPGATGQACLVSSETVYDCARWGNVTQPVHVLRSPNDTTATPSIPDGLALARRTDTGVVAADFVLQAPTPRQPNDGTVWFPPDAGPEAMVPDAPLEADAESFVDARPIIFADVRNVSFPDANLTPPLFLTANPGGGAWSCQLAVGRRAPLGAAVLLVFFAALALATRRRFGSQ